MLHHAHMTNSMIFEPYPSSCMEGTPRKLCRHLAAAQRPHLSQSLRQPNPCGHGTPQDAAKGHQVSPVHPVTQQAPNR